MPGSPGAWRDGLHGGEICIAFRPRRGVHEGWIMPRGMARRRGRLIPRTITMRESLLQSVHVCLQQQVLGSIYVARYVQPLQRLWLSRLNMHLLKCWGSATLGEGVTPASLDPDYKFLRSPLRPTPPSCVTCLLGPFARGPCVRGIDFPGPPCCPGRCIPGSLLQVAPVPGVVAHGPPARPAGILPAPLRHDCLR